MNDGLAIIGFGEAAQAFASGAALSSRVYDRKTDDPVTAAAKRAEMTALGVTYAADNAGAIAGAGLVLSLVTADQALAAAEETARAIPANALYCDMNSVAPDTKCAAAHAIEAAGGRYADIAVMAPVYPAGRAVPLLVSGSHAGAAAKALRGVGFTNVRALPGAVGRASSIKMIRSVMIKGVEALTAECVLAAHRAGVLEEVLASFDASPPSPDWGPRADYRLDRMLIHGGRRAAEMEEVVKTIAALGVEPSMTRGTIERQRALGALGLARPPAGLAAKLAAIDPPVRSEVA